MDNLLTGITVLIVLGTIAVHVLVRQQTTKHLIVALQHQQYAEFFSAVDSWRARLTIPRFNREYLKMNAYNVAARRLTP